MDKNLLQLYFDKIKKFFGIPAVILSLILGFLFWYLKPELMVSVGAILPIFLVLVILIIPLIDLLIYLYHQNKNKRLPKVLASTKYPSGDTVLLLSESNLFTNNSIVSIYNNEDDFEHLIGFGTVINVQENGKIQVGIYSTLDGFDEHFEKIDNNDKTYIDKLVIKPNTSNVFLKIKD